MMRQMFKNLMRIPQLLYFLMIFSYCLGANAIYESREELISEMHKAGFKYVFFASIGQYNMGVQVPDGNGGTREVELMTFINHVDKKRLPELDYRGKAMLNPGTMDAYSVDDKFICYYANRYIRPGFQYCLFTPLRVTTVISAMKKWQIRTGTQKSN